jgi:hypothetical protein
VGSSSTVTATPKPNSDAGLTADDLDLPLEAARLHALLDGLAAHAVMRPDQLPPPASPP